MDDGFFEKGPPVGVFLVQLEGLGEVGLLRHAAARACGWRQIERQRFVNRGKDSITGKSL